MKNQFVYLLSFFLIAVFVAVSVAVFMLYPVPLMAQLAPDQLVPKDCNAFGISGACGVCDFFKLVQNVLDFIFWGLVIPLAIIFVVYGGFLMIVPGASPNMLERGKKSVRNALVGLLIVFLAFLMVDTVIKLLVNQQLGTDDHGSLFPALNNIGTWNEIECEVSGGSAFNKPNEPSPLGGGAFPPPPGPPPPPPPPPPVG